MSALKIVEENPGIAIGAVVLILLVLTMRGGSNSPSAQAMINAQLKAQDVASRTDVAISGQNAQLAATRTKIMGDVYKTQIVQGAQFAVAKDTNTVRTALGLANADSRNRQIAAELEAKTQTVAANRATAAQALNTQLAINQDNTDLKHYQLEQTYANLPMLFQHQQNMGQISSTTAQAIASLQAQPGIAAAQAQQTGANAAAAKSSSDSSMQWVGTIASIAAMFFSDQRLKTDIKHLYTRADNLNVYEYRYVGEPSNSVPHIGVMAQEVEKVFPHAVRTMDNGFKAVDYAAMF